MKTRLLSLFLALLTFSAIPVFAQDAQTKPAPAKLEKATFAGGCFWCMQPPFDKAKGVVSTLVGFCGGKEKNPTYEQVSSGSTGYRESIEVTYDPAQISYEQLLDIFWRNINPTQNDGQFADIGPQYRSAIFYHSEEQKRTAKASKEKLARSGKFQKRIVTDILPVTAFYRAEEYHQKYYLKNPEHYQKYKVGSGRAGFLHSVWGDEATH